MDVLTYSLEGLKSRLPRLYHRKEILDIYVSLILLGTTKM